MKQHLKHNQVAGFSLIELLVIISIISMLVVLTMPRFDLFKIKAARVEMYQNLNFLGKLIVTYKAEHEKYPPPYRMGVYSDTRYSYNFMDCQADQGFSANGYVELGYVPPNCQKMRYYYQYSADGGSAWSSPAASNALGRTWYNIYATNAQVTHSIGANVKYGAPAPTSRCSKPDSNYGVWYADSWMIDQNEVLAPSAPPGYGEYSTGIRNDVYDAASNCFKVMTMAPTL